MEELLKELVEKNRKFVCVDPHDMPIVAIVDPGMMMTMPKELTAATGLDALTHAIEGFTTKAAWEMTDMFHLKAIELIAKYLRKAVENDEEAKEKMKKAMEAGNIEDSKKDREALEQAIHKVAEQMDAAGQQEQQEAGGGEQGEQTKADDNVVDADYTVVDDDKK